MGWSVQLGDDMFMISTLDDSTESIKTTAAERSAQEELFLEPLLPKLPAYDFDAGLTMYAPFPCLTPYTEWHGNLVPPVHIEI